MQLKLATLNFWGGPWPITRDKKKRLKKLIEVIKKEDFDILALQELWLNRDFKKLKSEFSKYHFYKRKGLIFNPSGLILMSRFPLTNKKYIPLNCSKHSLRHLWQKLTFKESLFEKGLLQASINIRKNKVITVTNIHLNYCIDYKICGLQYSRIFSSIRPKNNLILGDFNIDFSSLILPKNYHVLSNPKHPTLENTNTYSKTFFNKFHYKKQTLDFIISNSKCRLIKTKTDNQNIISDHYLVSTLIEV